MGSGDEPEDGGLSSPQATFSLPVFDAYRCVHGLLATSSCQTCVDACPHEAIVLADHALGLDEEACTGCMLCRPACPETAISFPTARFEPLIDRQKRVAMWACTNGRQPQGQGQVACLHAIGEREIAALAAAGLETVCTACAGCTQHPRDVDLSFETALARTNLMRLSRRLPPLRHDRVGEEAWLSRRAVLLGRSHDLDQSRRRLFRALVGSNAAIDRGKPTGSLDIPDALYRFVPAIDEVLCVGCDACAKICPHEAIRLEGLETGSPRYVLEAENCTGCSLCRDVCESGAVMVKKLAPRLQDRVVLQLRHCSKCGASFHRPAMADNQMAGSGTDVCRICAVNNPCGWLFQVQS